MKRVFFTDRDLGKQFPQILRDGGLHVERHADHFAQNAADVDWLKAVGQKNWVVITHDQRIRYKPNERAAVIDNRVSMLVVIGRAPFATLARNFVTTYPLIEAFLNAAVSPFIAKVYQRQPSKNPGLGASGRISQWYPR